MSHIGKFEMPVLLGNNYEHVMGQGNIFEEGGEVTITIKAKGTAARDLLILFENMPPMALSFAGIPVQPPSQKKEN